MDLKSRNNNLEKSLAIIMCTKNGAAYIYEQLYSIKNQTYQDFDIYISDNLSSDTTKKIINSFKKENPHINIILSDGDDKHFANNFIELVQSVDKKYNYFAFCDQDDIWENFHLKRCIETLKSGNLDKEPALICSPTILINSNGQFIGNSKTFKKPPLFCNALVQSIAGGNTMVFNYQAYQLLLKTKIYGKIIPSHDWLLYLLVTSHSGSVLYYPEPSVLYRQHSNNLIGSNKGLKALIFRAKKALSGQWKEWIDINIDILLKSPNLSSMARREIDHFEEMRCAKRVTKRLTMFRKSGVYRQSLFGNINLIISIILKKL